MGLSDTKIHQIELLLTLDYLLHYTDEDNPATQIDICEHARNYGLEFNKNATTGNQVRRQRIGDCLKFLKQITDLFPDEVPFVLETTNSGKYYIEQRHGLNENQVAKILAAISNDKYTADEDADFLIDRVLSAFSSSKGNRDLIRREYKSLIRGGKKFDKETLRRINLVEKAYREGKMILINPGIDDADSKKRVNYSSWYRVYLIKEYQNKPYAFMLLVGQNDLDESIGNLAEGYLFKPIEAINVAIGPDSKILCNDFDDHRDFDQLFREKCPSLADKYKNVDTMLEKKILPNGGNSIIASFYFDWKQKDVLEKSFEQFFSEDFRYQKTNRIGGIESQVQDIVSDLGNWEIVAEETAKNECPQYGLVNVSIDSNSLKSWLLSDPFGDGQKTVSDMVTIIKPLSINEEIAEHHYFQLMKRRKYLSESSKRNLIRVIGETEKEEKEMDDVFDDENEIVYGLDRSLATKENIMFTGLPGSGKTSIVKAWLKRNAKKVSGYYIDCASIREPFGKAREKNGLILIGQLFDNAAIDSMLSEPNRVIVVDNYHLLSKTMKSHILLLSDGYVVDGREESGFKKIDNLEFVCVIETTGV